MLKLENITKEYRTGDDAVMALRGVSISFRKSEFVAILGPSGCGKTTLLNIIGGLDRCTSGELSVNGVSTREYKDRDWDSYRNHSVGFVFQTYNLIMHQSVIANVELALTLSGVSKSERRRRAAEVLEKVGLKNQMNKRPNQLSGGQMQRVAIARALINDPEILLADEPTGALDSETSVQIMEILKKISNERLIIMVTHNPELAARYATRTVRLLDGCVTDDSNPSTEQQPRTVIEKTEKKPSMSYKTAISLSFNNLLTKKARTLLTALAGSIGIIGIALVLSLSSGFQEYINKVQEDTLSTYPIAIESESVDYSAMFSGFGDGGEDVDTSGQQPDTVYSKDVMSKFFSLMFAETEKNDLVPFAEYLTENIGEFEKYSSAIQYEYNFDLNIYASDTAEGVVQVNPSSVMESAVGEIGSIYAQSSLINGQFDIWDEMIDNTALLESQYEVVAGDWPKNFNEVVIIVDKNNRISDYTLYALGLKDQSELSELLTSIMKGNSYEAEQTAVSYEELLALQFKLVLNTAYYEYDDASGIWNDVRKTKGADALADIVDNGVDLKVVGIIKPSDKSTATALTGAIGYLHSLTEYVMNGVADTDIVKQQLADTDTDVFTGLPFGDGQSQKFDISQLTEEQQQYLMSLPEEQREELIAQYSKPTVSDSTYKANAELLGIASEDAPSAIYFYPVDFEAKDSIAALIADYNKGVSEDEQIMYTDYIGTFISSVSTIIDAIAYVLIAFVSISLVVSSIMIGVITYISVLERTKEIGILRSVGASKRDVSRVFNAETLIIGFTAGVIGIGLTLLLLIPCNIIIKSLTGIADIAALPVVGALMLVAISTLLTLIAGLIPSKMAAKRDPVEALRSES